MSAPELGVGAVVDDDGRLLLVRRSAPPGPGTWAVPGGGVEAGETLAEAVTRELERDEARRRLKEYIPDYDKNLTNMFIRTSEQLETAYRNAARERALKAETGKDNPSTDMDILVKRLFEIASMRDAGNRKEPI